MANSMSTSMTYFGNSKPCKSPDFMNASAEVMGKTAALDSTVETIKTA